MASNKTDKQLTKSSEDNDVEEIKAPLKDRIKESFSNFLYKTRLFIYNKQYQTFFGQTSSNWIKLSIYYIFFYFCLGLFYCGMVAVFGAIISRESPRYLYHNSQMNDNGNCYVGMGFRPMPDITSNSITVYNSQTSQSAMTLSISTYRIKFLTQYDQTYTQECSPTVTASQLGTMQTCQFSWADIVNSDSHPCSDSNLYGWKTGKPCVLVKLNKIYGWTPTVGNIVDQVANATGQPIMPDDARQDNIYITCNSENQDNTSALGSLIYYSILHPFGNSNYGGIPYYFYPYLNTPEHVEPFVLVQFLSLPLDRTLTVQCRAWAPNIAQLSLGKTVRGMVTFTLYKFNQAAPGT